MRRTKNSTLPIERIEQLIYFMRGRRVMLDTDLAVLYGVTVKRFNEQIKRNLGRFPEDFMFQITLAEAKSLRSQFATLDKGRGGYRKYLPFVFTEYGALMAANVLKTKRAVEVSVLIVRIFVKLRDALYNHQELSEKINELDQKVGQHDESIGAIINTIRKLMAPAPNRSKRRIGFAPSES